MRNKDELDKMIDAALATYGDPGADDLEVRVLRGVRLRLVSESKPRRLRWLACSAALAAAACVLALVFFISRPAMKPVNNAHTQQTPRDTKAVAATTPPPATPQETVPRPANAMRTRNPLPVSTQTAKAEPLPKLNVFPAPAPLDGQVEVLAFFIRQAPPNEVKELLAEQAQADAPLEVKELEIPPLEPLDEGGK
jgi:hypothetical protein